MSTDTPSSDPLDLVPSAAAVRAVALDVVAPAGLEPDVTLGVPVPSEGDVPAVLGLDREQLARWGFTGRTGQTLVLPRAEGTLVAVGTGVPKELDAAVLRDAAAAYARAVPRDAVVTTTLADTPAVDAEDAGAAVVEGVLLGRYRYDALRSETPPGAGVPLERIVLVVPEDRLGGVRRGAGRGKVLARAALVSRDLASAPGGLLTAVALADVAVRLGETEGFDVEVFDRAALEEMGCGGILGVNAGSAHEPRLVRLAYRPGTSRAHLGLVGKGITYDSGGISLKPSDAMHAAMKMDMTGAGAVLAAVSVLRELDVAVSVTAYLACTDNMPSGTATMLGDVLTTRSGRTIEVVNTDAEGRLVMSDALALAVEDGVDAVVDVATLTGACLQALGMLTAGLIGNNEDLQRQVELAAARTDERVWRLPLDRRYRSQLDSQVADIKNLGGPFAGAVTAALFLAEWVGDTPWAHLDIAGPMRSEHDDAWRTAGATGFGARLLVDLAADFQTPGA
ncbi:leucyl aminopeptidase [Cellulomonas sp. P22]|uniref:leucyl aminopeptidase n=1 Tax=Cellulomonas sp. P22 TaxID=3373189 RepID=UPI0037B2A96E